MTLDQVAAIVGIAGAISVAVGFIFRAAHDRNLDAHDGIVGKLQAAIQAGSAQKESLVRIEQSLIALNLKMDKFQDEYWQHRSENRERTT